MLDSSTFTPVSATAFTTFFDSSSSFGATVAFLTGDGFLFVSFSFCLSVSYGPLSEGSCADSN